MRTVWSKKVLGIPVILTAVIAALAISGAALGVIYTNNLNRTFNGSATVIERVEVVEVTLYTDALATNPIPGDYLHAFPAVTEGGGPPLSPLWFRAAEVTPSTVRATAAGLPSGASLGYVVGTPMASQPGKPCPLALWLDGMPVGTHSFTITVTGTGP